MTRMTTYLLAALIAAAPLSAAAQDRGDRDRPRFESQERARPDDRSNRPRQDSGRDNGDRPRMSESSAQRIAQSRAGDARFVGSMGMRGDSYVFRFERDGRIIDVPVRAN
ncbi:hypothetical protein ACIQC9_09960 [Brevundimonas sp. NPDC092305]|uniref:hypothetical protein n=1 Tax=Brevundimonas sp. NPDC092305 TaxID=3363957 RepID=UPI0038120EA9